MFKALSSGFQQASRTIRRRPGFSIAAALTLALGIGPTTAIVSVAYSLLLRELPYPDADRIVVIWEADRTQSPESAAGLISHPTQHDIRREAHSLEAVAQWRTVDATLTGLGPAELTPLARVTSDFFRVFNSVPVIGRGFSDADDVYRGPKVVILSDGFWHDRLGGRADVLGHTLTIGGEPHEIIGVAPTGFTFPQDVDMWLPLQNNPECGRGCMNSVGIARLAESSSLDDATEELRVLAARLEAAYPASNANVFLRVAPLRDVVVGSARTPILLLLAAVGMVLLIACANVANLLLVNGDARRVEIAVRAALGANRMAILRQLMMENMLLALGGGGAGLLMAAWIIAGLKAIAPAGVPRIAEIGIDAEVLVFAAAIVLSTTLIFGLMPALRITGAGFAQALRHGRGSSNASGSQRFRTSVIVAEVTLSVMLLLGATLMVRSMVRMRTVALGIETGGVMQFRLTLPAARYPTPEAALAFMRQLDERLENIDNVERASAMIGVPFTGMNIFSGFARTDRLYAEPGQIPTVTYRALDEDAFAVLGIRLVRGRAFASADRWGTEPVALINETAAQKYWPGEDPVGKQIELDVSVGYPESEPRTVIGVTADFRRAVTETPLPEIYVPYAQAGASFPQIAIRYRGSEAGAAMVAAQREVQSLDPALAVARPGSIEALVREDLAAPTFYLMLMGLFAALAILLAAVGIYSVAAYLVLRRKHEIGIRMALGAGVGQIMRGVVWQSLRPALIGAAAGIAGALATARLTRSILFETAPTDPIAIIATVLLLLGVVLLATAIPTVRASRIPPSEALRS